MKSIPRKDEGKDFVTVEYIDLYGRYRKKIFRNALYIDVPHKDLNKMRGKVCIETQFYHSEEFGNYKVFSTLHIGYKDSSGNPFEKSKMDVFENKILKLCKFYKDIHFKQEKELNHSKYSYWVTWMYPSDFRKTHLIEISNMFEKFSSS